MSSRDELPGSDASAKTLTRSGSGILTPVSDNYPTLSDSTFLGSKKRKRDGNSMEDLLEDRFVVKPYPSAVFVKPRTLQPLILLPRAYLPLASLDLTSSTSALPQSRLFEAHVKILELEERMGSQPMVLIARLDDGRTLYAVEREDRGLYVICRLGSWVDLHQLKEAAIVSKQELPEGLERRNSIRHNSPAPLITPESSKYSKKKRLAIEAIQSMVKRPSTGLLTESQLATAELEPIFDTQPAESTVEQPPIDDPVTRTAAELFDSVRTQYLEALYISKASLAYFAKGPLSRTRAAFHLDYDSTLDMNDHVAFLESLVMSTTLIDKKYRDGVPECVSLIDIQDHSVDEAIKAASKPKKRKTNKKVKPGKNGLYPTEDTLIRRWWSNYDDELESGAPGTSKDEMTKSRIAQLRIRETQLQIIVILEVLALQPLATGSDDVDSGLPSGHPKSNIVEGKEKNTNAKKPDHFAMLIDVHIDRLCIWQSIQLESMKAPSGESQNSTGELGNSTGSSTNGDSILRDFCVEVIAPFFSARLPDRCAVINRKLGGPVAFSPPKPRLSKSSSFSGPSRPGAATKRPVPAKPRRSLHRVLTDDRERRSVSRGPERAISLMRSATMPTIPGLKREASEAPSLSGIPFAESQTLAANRGGVLNSKRFSRREVDLGSLAPDWNSKAKKKASIEAELKQAISALKKPNRELAGKDLVETAEQRSTSASHSRKSKKPIRNPLFQGVQISATPKANRSTNVFAKSQPQEFPRYDEVPQQYIAPSPSMSVVPQSVSRPSRESLQLRNPLFSSVPATPTRRPLSASSAQREGFLGINNTDQASFPPSSPLHMRRSSAQLFIVHDSAVKRPTEFSTAQGIQETPVKKRPEDKLQHSHPAPSPGGNKENTGVKVGVVDDGSKSSGGRQEESIYKALGWDDDIDDLA
ncbi:hypothetical protein LOCC1_G007360 [Lachnellula occidentalis]|uniref:DNA replication regulator Sld3 C-terminal domain-containing protein n=1 Tax=Lachnellula occidentalis TaxID=215460 RepID=A0A8H8RPX4_9HELO|nr:hypothetical protein LOCC1_G007360 [Lachnellula occidentalis]